MDDDELDYDPRHEADALASTIMAAGRDLTWSLGVSKWAIREALLFALPPRLRARAVEALKAWGDPLVSEALFGLEYENKPLMVRPVERELGGQPTLVLEVSPRGAAVFATERRDLIADLLEAGITADGADPATNTIFVLAADVDRNAIRVLPVAPSPAR